MTDNKNGEGSKSHESSKDGGDESMSRGNGWEVVSLTASAYAASPGPRGPEFVHEEKEAADLSDAETSKALFMSGHFVFPPSQHENLPLEEGVKEIHREGKVHMMEEAGRSQRKEDNILNSVALFNEQEDFNDIPGFEGKDERLTIHDLEYDEISMMRGENFMDLEQVMFGSGSYSSFNSGAVPGGSPNPHDLIESTESNHDDTVPLSKKNEKGDKHDDYELPSGTWWKKPVARLRAHAKETNAVWSIFIAAAVMGLVILGQKWQQERWQVLQQRWQLSLNSEKSGRAISSLSRFKDIIVGGSRHGSYISHGVAADH